MAMTGASLVIEEIVRTVDEHCAFPLLVVLGFDGVLVDYDDHPERVRLSAASCSILRAFANQPAVAVALVSGRRVTDLTSRAVLGHEVFYVGLHGLEIDGPGVRQTPLAIIESWPNWVHEIVALMAPSLSDVRGVRIEDKGAVVAMHTREADVLEGALARICLLSAAAERAGREGVRVIRGNHVIEVMPNVPNTRATAVAVIGQALETRERKPVFTLYIGEDTLGDEIFAAVEGNGVSVAVGAQASQAQYHLASPADVWRLIGRLVIAHAERGSDRAPRSGHSRPS